MAHRPEMVNTAAIRRLLPGLFAEFGVRSLLDIHCGDFVWMEQISASSDQYIGADIVEPLILVR
jgi:hypothetical protein